MSRNIEERWKIHEPIPPKVNKNLGGFPHIVRQLLYNRGFKTAGLARFYLQASQPLGADAENILGIDVASERLVQAIESGEPIVIYGDYDVDGITAAALLVRYIKSEGGDARAYIPHRVYEGYGLNVDALSFIKKFVHASLVISVDCGIRAVEQAQFAKDLGIDLIICDHHEPGKELPNAFSIIDPKQSGDTYCYKELTAVGLAYKLAQGLSNRLSSWSHDPDEHLDLVALGTVADVADLVEENRHLVYRGIKVLNKTKKVGISILAEMAGLNLGSITASDIGFGLGPRINAAGRLSSALASYFLLVKDEPDRAREYAKELNKKNGTRQWLTRKYMAELTEDIKGDQPVLLLHNPDVSLGVVGLIASKIKEAYYRPAIVGKSMNGIIKASCRSIPEIHITEALEKCADLLENFGGHAAAAGLTIKRENLPELEDRLQEIVDEQVDVSKLAPVRVADMEIELSELDDSILKLLEWFEPTGKGNSEAVFVTRGVEPVDVQWVGKSKAHLKMKVKRGDTILDSIAFNQGDLRDIPERLDIMYTYTLNTYRGKTTPQLQIKSIQIHK